MGKIKYDFHTPITGPLSRTKSDNSNLMEAYIGVEFSTCFTKIQDKLIKSQLWDTSGRNIFGPVIKSYYKIFIVKKISIYMKKYIYFS